MSNKRTHSLACHELKSVSYARISEFHILTENNGSSYLGEKRNGEEEDEVQKNFESEQMNDGESMERETWKPFPYPHSFSSSYRARAQNSQQKEAK